MSEAVPEPERLQDERLPGQPGPNPKPGWLLEVAIRIGLILAVLAVYGQVRHFDFIPVDDGTYVWDNLYVRAGLTPETIEWAFTSAVTANWMPVTMLSHMLDCQLFGLASGMHHLTNVLIHILASLSLFAVMRRATGALGASAFVAFVFALHPLHVESVAWVAERKDVLSAFFFFLALYAYVCYTELPSLSRYLLVVGLFCLGLMSKPMLVTFPFALLLFDFWPLQRVQCPKILWEKAPFMVLSAGACVATYLNQRSAGAFIVFPLARRLGNAAISYVTYVGQMFWPTRLAAYYPYPDSVPVWQPAGALAILVGISVLTIYMRRTRPYFVTGWFWYLGMLVPVIGLVQVGGQSHADRYTYIPMVGLSWILAWGAADVLKSWPHAKPAFAAAVVVSCAACMAVSWTQTGFWRNGVTLFEHTLDVTGNNRMARLDLASAHNNIAATLALMPGHYEEALSHYEAALRLNPQLWSAHRDLGVMLSAFPGRAPEAIAHLEAAQRIHSTPELVERIKRLREQQ